MLPNARVTVEWSLRPATPGDAEWLANLKAAAMRPDLERLGRWRHDWARQRFLDTYVPGNTHIVLVGGEAAGCVAVRTEPHALWIEHFYLHPHLQGQGLGGQVLDHVLTRHHGQTFMLAVFAAARRANSTKAASSTTTTTIRTGSTKSWFAGPDGCRVRHRLVGDARRLAS